jgi:hypothetical protein
VKEWRVLDSISSMWRLCCWSLGVRRWCDTSCDGWQYDSDGDDNDDDGDDNDDDGDDNDDDGDDNDDDGDDNDDDGDGDENDDDGEDESAMTLHERNLEEAWCKPSSWCLVNRVGIVGIHFTEYLERHVRV